MFFVSLFSVLASAATAKPSDNPQLAVLDSIVLDAIHDHQIPGAVLLVGHNGQVIYRKAFGNRALEPHREPMTVDTIFDIASLTKVVATTTAVMQLVQKGEVRLNDPVTKYVPEFAGNGKDDITVRNLLTHFSGLREDFDLDPPWQGRDAGLRLAFDEKPVYPAGSRFLYSDTNFIVSGRVGGTCDRNHPGAILRAKNLQPFADGAHPLSAARSLAARRSLPLNMTSKARCCAEWCTIPARAAWAAWPGMPDFSPPLTISQSLPAPCCKAARSWPETWSRR